MGANLIMWEAIRLGKKLGAQTFDMWGSAPEGYPEHHVYAGFTRFKEGYGAQFFQTVGSHDLIANPTLYTLYTNAYKLRTWYLTMRANLSL
jgi:lipid II:glycine glycyltransferase (peptidoglycan interpeptide bridge formation enzyme)